MKFKPRIRGSIAVFCDLLLEIRDNPGITPTNLTTNLNMQYPSVMRRLNVLDAEGFLKIEEVKRDKRKTKNLHVTDEGRTLAYRWASILKKINALRAREPKVSKEEFIEQVKKRHPEIYEDKE